MYKLYNENIVQRLSDKTSIPIHAFENIDTQEYVRWLSLGNTPLPSDPPPEIEPSQIQGIIDAIDTIDFKGNTGQEELALMLQALAFILVEKGG